MSGDERGDTLLAESAAEPFFPKNSTKILKIRFKFWN